MVIEAVQLAGRRASAGLRQHLQAGPLEGVRGFLAMWREVLLGSKFHIGCPVMAVAVEEPIDEVAKDALRAAMQVFGEWQALLEASLREHGYDETASSELATLIIASVEGAIVLCRAQRNIAPFDRVARQLEALLGSR
jgi:hypothetical protein